MDRHNIKNDSSLTHTFHIDSNDTNSNNKKDNGILFNGKAVSKVSASSLEDYLLDGEFDNDIFNRVIKASKEDVAMPSVRDISDYKLTDSQINRRVERMVKSCENGHSIVIYYTNAQTSAMLLWDPVKQKPVYTTFNQQGVVVDSSDNLNALRQDIQMYSDSRYKNLKVKLKGLNTQTVLNKLKEGNNNSFHPQNNNSAQYIASLLKASFPQENFVNDTAEQMSIDTNNLAKEIKHFIKKKVKEDKSESVLVANNSVVSPASDVNQHLWGWENKIRNENSFSVEVNHKDEDLSSNRDSYLGSSIEILKKATTSVKAREALTALFGSKDGRKLFTENYHDVSKNGVLTFIKYYKNAIALEVKETQARNLKHHEKREEKKEERLLAIDKIETFAKRLDSSDPEFEDKCDLILQMLGRVRECSFVSQRNMKLCGGFASIQLGWREKPLRMVCMCIQLARSNNRSVQVETSVPGHLITFKIDKNIDLNDYKSPYADVLLLAAIYDLKEIGTYVEEDAMVMTYLGLEPLVGNLNMVAAANEDVVLDDLCEASNKGAKFRGVIRKGYLNPLLFKKTRSAAQMRKYTQAENIDAELSLSNRFEQNPHALVIDGIKRINKNGGEYVALKIHNYGRRVNIIMKEKSFFKNFLYERFVLVNAGDSRDYYTFRPLGNTTEKGDNKEFTMYRDGRVLYSGY